MKLPITKNTDILVQETGKELLVYNLTTHKAFCLNETSSAVFYACDGETSFDELKLKYKFTDDLIYFALDELNNNNLIQDYQSNHFGNLSRREVVKQVGLATMIALPVILSITAPRVAQAASCRTTGQTGGFSTLGPRTSQTFCEVLGYIDPACCTGVSKGTFNDATTTCTGITCT